MSTLLAVYSIQVGEIVPMNPIKGDSREAFVEQEKQSNLTDGPEKVLRCSVEVG
jgi:hypothetical protein